MLELKFTITGTPTGKGRVRFFNGHAVTPQTTRNYEAQVKYEASHALEHMVVRPDHHAPCSVKLSAFYEIPRSYTKKKRALIASQGCAVVRPGKPDLDNVIKSVLDGMNGIVFHDDVQVIKLTAEKLWCLGDELPRVEVRVLWNEQEERE